MSNAQADLFETEPALVQALLDGCEALVVVADAAGAVVYANPLASSLAACPSPIGQPIWMLWADDPEAERRFFEGLVGGGHPASRQTGTHASGPVPRRIRWHYTCIDGDREPLRWVVATGIDMTEAVAAASATEGSEAHLRAVLDTAVDAIITIDHRGVVRSFNPAAERMFGYPAREVLGQNIKMLMAGEHRRDHDSYLQNYLTTGVRRIIGIGRDVEGRRADDSRFPLELAVSEVRFDGQRHFTGILRDLSERRAAELRERRRLDELAHASRLSAMGEMSSGIAHELNQPLAAIVTFAQACQRLDESDQLDRSTLREALTQMATQGQRAGAIVSRLRRMSRKDSGSRAPVDINGTVRDVLTLMAHDLRLREVALVTDLDDEVAILIADRVQIEQVIVNLVRNALDAMDGCAHAAAELQIHTQALPDGGILVEVLDTGGGLASADPEQVFEAFFTTKPDGVGIGLSISRSIIEAHGGHLRAENRPAGGACFAFTLPGTCP